MKKVEKQDVKATYIEFGDNFCPNYKTCLKKFMRELNMFSIAMSVMYEITQSNFERDFIELEKNVYTLDLEKKKVNKILINWMKKLNKFQNLKKKNLLI